jgi:Dolichyl-phosphate-mannose-protein mannosyltransferase
MIATNETARPAVLVGRLDRDKLLQRLSLGFALLVSAILNLWNLSQNGYDNEYYATAVQSMLQNWHNFFFASYDAGGYITVDKPPVALWMQAISAKIFGFGGPALLVPVALAGVASVALLYFLVKRIFGPLAGFAAALALALNPIAVAVERSNNTDTWLMFTLLLAAWVITRATEKGAFRLLALSMALVGVAFNVKMLEAWIVLPTFFLLYLAAAPLSRCATSCSAGAAPAARTRTSPVGSRPTAQRWTRAPTAARPAARPAAASAAPVTSAAARCTTCPPQTNFTAKTRRTRRRNLKNLRVLRSFTVKF